MRIPAWQQRAALCALGLKKLKPFFFSHGRFIDFRRAKNSACGSGRALARATGRSREFFPAQKHLRKIGVVTAALRRFEAGAEEAWTRSSPAKGALDLFTSGGIGINVLYGALCDGDVRREGAGGASFRKFKLPWGFLDHPTDYEHLARNCAGCRQCANEYIKTNDSQTT